MGILPDHPSKAKLEVRCAILFGQPKVGKTSLFEGREDTLVLAFEHNSEHINSYRVFINNADTLREVMKELKNDTRFKYIVVDTITSAKPIFINIAEEMYMKTLIGKNWIQNKDKYKSIENLPNGQGWYFIRQAYDSFREYIESIDKRLIIVGHMKISSNEETGEVYKEIDMPQSIRSSLSAKAQVIGYIQRLNKNTNTISFNVGDNILSGCNVPQLANRTFVVSQMTSKGYKSYLFDILELRNLDKLDLANITTPKEEQHEGAK